MVFSTLHTNDAPSTITRLKDMGVPTFLITATVEAILAQRLVRRVCTQVPRGVRRRREELLDDLELTAERSRGQEVLSAAAAAKSATTRATRAASGLFELMIMNDELRDMIMGNASTDELRDAAAQARAWSRSATRA